MKPEEFVLDIKNGSLKRYYILGGDNKYVIDEYIRFATKKDKWSVLDSSVAFYELSNQMLIDDNEKFIICRLDDGEKGKKQLESFKALHSPKIVLLLSSKATGDENEVYFSTTAGIKRAEDFCKKNNIDNFPIKDSVEEFGLYKTMLELEKITILNSLDVNYNIDDILPLSEKYGGELKIFDLDFSEFVDFEEYPMSVKIEKDILTMIRIREIIQKPISEIKRISGIENEKMIYLFSKYAKKYSLEDLIKLFYFVDDLRQWIKLGMKEGYFRDLLILKLNEIRRR